MIHAEIVADSISEAGKRLTTFKLRYPKFIHGEFMTHRVFSRNASSSRAIPIKKLIEEVEDSALRAAPVFWGMHQKGMQATQEFSGYSLREVKQMWADAAMSAARFARSMDNIGMHKQTVNRILEPFSHINVVCSATEYDNFFGLRLDKMAQPEMRALAEAMWKVREASRPLLLKYGHWHLPFIDDEDRQELWLDHFGGNQGNSPTAEKECVALLRKISVARCARVSYESYETGKRSTLDEDLALYDRLLGAQPLHASPAEHQATPDEVVGPFDVTVNIPTEEDRRESKMSTTITAYWANPNEHGNFIGWRQYRKMLPNEAVAPLPEGYTK